MTENERYIRLALKLARKGLGTTSPNPMVGAVVVKGNTIVGQGYHHRAGEPHAEILALRQAGAKARGATLYLNLEPCDHFGRTPPCTQAILEAGITRVVAGMKDPNPLVSGGGIRRLRKAGVQVDVGALEKECRELNAPFCKYITRKRPFVTLKAAASLDGKVATRSGDSRWISSETSRNYVHRLRQAMDAVMVGIGTVLKDDPLLTVRLPGGKKPRQPLRVIVDSRLRIPLHSQLVRTAGQFPTLVATTQAASSSRKRRLAGANVEVAIIAKDSRGHVSLRGLMKELARRGVVSLLLEGGSTLNASALKEGVVDRLLLFLAPKIIGGKRAPGVIAGDGAPRIKDAEAWEIVKVRRMGPDILIEGVPGNIKNRLCQSRP
jgi:diaminohydroxyphosphoribosylaminopyrimidine deaminase/5-amino-6-(5-phosphoribosylamino)uracil reductase